MVDRVWQAIEPVVGYALPITAAGLTLVEYRCSYCSLRWWVEEGKDSSCMHQDLGEPTGHRTHIRLVDF